MKCIVCGNDCQECLNLGVQPLANNLLSNPGEVYEKFPLGLEYCTNCSHGQLTHFVNPQKLFKNYLYASGTSKTLSDYFYKLSEAIVFKHGKKVDLLDVASNDGSFLTQAMKFGLKIQGIDPAENLVSEAIKKGIPTICDFFPSEILMDKYDVITAMNVCAHTPNPVEFLTGIRDSLKEDGTAYIQTSQALMLNSGEFDTIYHEHYSFFTVASMRRAAELAGLHLANYQLTSIHGTSYLFHLKKTNSQSSLLEIESDVETEPRLVFPKNINEEYEQFKMRASSTIENLKRIVGEHKEQGYQIVLAGVAAKALTVVRAAELSIDIFVDEAKLKIGKNVPEFTAPIAGFNELSHGSKQLVIIGAWNFSEEIISKLRTINPSDNMKFLIYFPEIKLL